MTRYVVLRDDDTNALTPAACLERLYAAALQAGTPISLAVVPAVTTRAVTPAGGAEGFLWHPAPVGPARCASIADEGGAVVAWLRDRPLVEVVQHGFCHELFELDRGDRGDIGRRLDDGARLLRDAGLSPAPAFVAPYDRMSRAAFQEVGRRFSLISTGWFEARRMPITWWPAFAHRRLVRRPHWRVGGVTLLSHPGCILSRNRPVAGMVDAVRSAVRAQRLTVLVTHWWEYFPDGQPDEALLAALHETLEWIERDPDVRVVSFRDVAAGRVPLD